MLILQHVLITKEISKTRFCIFILPKCRICCYFYRRTSHSSPVAYRLHRRNNSFEKMPGMDQMFFCYRWSLEEWTSSNVFLIWNREKAAFEHFKVRDSLTLSFLNLKYVLIINTIWDFTCKSLGTEREFIQHRSGIAKLQQSPANTEVCCLKGLTGRCGTLFTCLNSSASFPGKAQLIFSVHGVCAESDGVFYESLRPFFKLENKINHYVFVSLVEAFCLFKYIWFSLSFL